MFVSPQNSCESSTSEVVMIEKGAFRSWSGLMRASLVAQRLKNLLGTWETWVQSLGWEDPLEKGMATHSSIPAWRIPWIKDLGKLQSMESQSQT